MKAEGSHREEEEARGGQGDPLSQRGCPALGIAARTRLSRTEHVGLAQPKGPLEGQELGGKPWNGELKEERTRGTEGR